MNCDCELLEHKLKVAERIIKEEGGTSMWVYYLATSGKPADNSWIKPLVFILLFLIASIYFYKPNHPVKNPHKIEMIQGTNIEI